MLLGWLVAYIKTSLSYIKNGCLFIYIKRRRKEKKPIIQIIQKEKKKKTNILPAS